MNESLITSIEGLKFVSKWEGKISRPYLDVAKKWTIGVGHLIKPTDSFSLISNDQVKSLLTSKDKNHPVAKIALPDEEIFNILSKDVSECEASIKKNIKVALNQNQFDALVSFGFNCGVGVYSKSGVATALNTGKYEEVPTRLLDWDKARVDGVLQPVLRTRRKSEGQLFSKPAIESQNQIEPSAAVMQSNDPIVPWTKNELKIAQQQLKKIGLYSLGIDGIWGNGTKSGITAFANSIGTKLPVDSSKGVPLSLLNELKKR